MASAYKGWDVHSYTNDVQDFIRNLNSDIRDFFFSVIIPRQREALVTAWPADLEPVKRKWIERTTMTYPAKTEHRPENAAFMYMDPDVENMNIWSIAVLTYDLACRYGCTELFWEMVRDAGTTCIQGDSHRILMLYIALVRHQL